MIFAKVDVVEEWDDLGSANKEALKIDVHGGGVIGWKQKEMKKTSRARHKQGLEIVHQSNDQKL